MKPPPRILVVDAAILTAAVLGRSSSAFIVAGAERVLITTDRAVAETRRRLELGLQRTDLLQPLQKLLSNIEIVPVELIDALIERAERALREAVPSRNGSVSDAHLLALAWDAVAEIWSHDRDFAGTGVASWSTENLLAAVAEASG